MTTGVTSDMGRKVMVPPRWDFPDRRSGEMPSQGAALVVAEPFGIRLVLTETWIRHTCVARVQTTVR